jgi:hypothetical protein
LGVELVTEAQHQVGSVGHLDGEPDVRGGLVDGLGEPGGVDADLGWLVVLAGPSSLMREWKWTTPRRWNSATLTNDTRHRRPNSAALIPAWCARVRRTAMVNRRQSSGACQLKAMWAG